MKEKKTQTTERKRRKRETSPYTILHPRAYREISPGVRLGIAQLRAVLASRDDNEVGRNLRERAGFNARSLQVYIHIYILTRTHTRTRTHLAHP